MAQRSEQVAAFDTEFHSERIVRAWLDVLVAVRNGTDGARLPLGSSSMIADLFEKMGNLVRAGHVGQGSVYAQFAFNIRYAWARLAPRPRRAAGGRRAATGRLA